MSKQVEERQGWWHEGRQWCACPNDRMHRFCERHQEIWCVICEGRCTTCTRTWLDDYFEDEYDGEAEEL